VAGEEYRQLVTSAEPLTPRYLRSDIVLVCLDDGSVAGFRHVFEENGSAVRDRQDRPLTSFRMPSTAASLDQARVLSAESRRHYLSPALGLLDEPTLPLQFLLQQNQDRFTVTLDSVSTMDGAQVAVLTFEERMTPRVIPSPDSTPVSGRFRMPGLPGRGEMGAVYRALALHELQALWSSVALCMQCVQLAACSTRIVPGLPSARSRVWAVRMAAT